MNFHPFYDSGPALYLDTDDFAVFGTQSCTPEVVILEKKDFVPKASKVKKMVRQLHSNTRKSRGKDVDSSRLKLKGTVIPLDDDDDDFVSPPALKRKSNIVFRDEDACSRGSSDDFVTQEPKNQRSGTLVLSNKRATIISKKLRDPVEKLVPYEFPHLPKAKSIKSLILSPDFLQKHGK